MSTMAPTQPALSLPLPPPEEVVRITVDRYEQMIESGSLEEDDPIELLNGVMVWKRAKSPQQSAVTRGCVRTIERSLPPGWHVHKEDPVRIPDYDEPEPEIAVVRGDDDLYLNRHPGPGDIALIIEVSDSSLRRDRGEKCTIYARSGIPAYWIINLVDRQLECYSSPSGETYPPPAVLGDAEFVDLIIDGRAASRIAIADLLPKP